jgi:hypothetical protein
LLTSADRVQPPLVARRTHARSEDTPDRDCPHYGHRLVAAAPGQRPRASNRARKTSTAPSATSPSTSPSRRPTATPSPPNPNVPTPTGSGTTCGSRPARNGAPTGCSTASSRRRPTANCGPATAKAKHTNAPRWASAGRRVLVSRDWSGKTLADHRADARAWVRALLGVTVDSQTADPSEIQTGTGGAGEPTPTAWELARPDDPDLQPLEHRLLRAISQRIQWRAELNRSTRPGDPTPTRRPATRCFGNRT